MSDVLTMCGIAKRFGGVRANDGIDFSLRRGEIHALLGENGAGKTTLMNVLLGLYLPDAGTIAIEGREAAIRSPRDAFAHGLGMVHQHFMLVSVFTALENIILGLRSPREPFLALGAARERARALMDRLGLRVDLDARVESLSVGEQQRVEILKVLYRGARILALDEPTAVLTPREARDLFRICRSLAAEGYAIIFISHKLDEVMDLCDRVTVLREGRVVGSVRVAETDPAMLARLMVGREVLLDLERRTPRLGRVVLEVEDLCARNDRGMPGVRHVSFALQQGAILGIAGVDGNGQLELAEALVGLRPKQSGTIRIEGEEIRRPRPADLMKKGLAYTPADRGAEGLVPEFSMMDNLVLDRYADPPFARRGLLCRAAIEAHCHALTRAFSIRPPSAHVPALHLSGGNQQKVILARALSGTPKILIVVQPTRGLDIGATEFVRRELLKQREAGVAILLISTELDEILSLSDRIAVMFRGEIVGAVRSDEVDLTTLGLMMAGQKPAA